MLDRPIRIVLIFSFVALVIISAVVLYSGLIELRGVQPEEVPLLEEMLGTGNYLVGKDIASGRYEAQGAEAGCNWQVLAGGIVLVRGEGSQSPKVFIAEHHDLFQTQRCGAWSLVPE